jgi:hypothetical protein
MLPQYKWLAVATALSAVVLSACGRDVPVSPTDFLDGAVTSARNTASAALVSDGVMRLEVGESARLSTTIVRRTRMANWSSSNDATATVSSGGTVTGRARGTATITARGSNGSHETFQVLVVPAVASVQVTTRTNAMLAGDTVTLVAIVRDAAGALLPAEPIQWSVVSGSAVSVSSAGLVRAVSGGAAVVQATAGGMSGSQSLTVGTPPVATLAVSPRTGTTLAPGATQQFSTTSTWSDLATRPVNVTYTATGGTITSGGFYTAGQVLGSFLVIANCGCGKADTAAVLIAAPAVTAQLTSLTISPKTATVNAGATQQFAARANWNTGATTLPPIVYSATGGAVTAGGLWTAPSTGGTYRVILAHSGGTLRDTATVTVQGTTTTTTTTTPTGLFFEDGFESGAKRNANGFTWATTTNPRVSNERAFSGSYALRFEYSAAPQNEYGWSEQRFDMGRYISEVAVEYMLYVPLNYQHRTVTNGAGNNKFLMLWRDTYGSQKGTWQVGMEFWRENDSLSRARFMSSRWDFDWVTDGFASENTPLIGAAGAIKPGQWNRVRFYVKAASSRTASDGKMHMWVNGQQLLNYNAGKFHNFNANVVDASLRNGYLMGWANSGFTETTTFFIDDVKFTQGNPGW